MYTLLLIRLFNCCPLISDLIVFSAITSDCNQGGWLAREWHIFKSPRTDSTDFWPRKKVLLLK